MKKAFGLIAWGAAGYGFVCLRRGTFGQEKKTVEDTASLCHRIYIDKGYLWDNVRTYYISRPEYWLNEGSPCGPLTNAMSTEYSTFLPAVGEIIPYARDKDIDKEMTELWEKIALLKPEGSLSMSEEADLKAKLWAVVERFEKEDTGSIVQPRLPINF